MSFVASFLSAKLRRTVLRAGAFFVVAVIPLGVLAEAVRQSVEPAVVAGLGRVVDGDTLDVGPTRVRLEGIDAPELSQTCKTPDGVSWECGKKAAALLRSMVQERDVACDRTGLDKYERTLAICFADGTNINEEMVEAGMAWAFVRYSTEFVAAEAKARAGKRGVWQGPAEAPWDFRRDEWTVAESRAPSGCAIKGNISSHGHIYHMPWSPWYDRVKIDEARGERWFCSEADALAAGWRPAAPN